MPRREVVNLLRERNQPMRLFDESEYDIFHRLKVIQLLEIDSKGFRNDLLAAMGNVDEGEDVAILVMLETILARPLRVMQIWKLQSRKISFPLKSWRMRKPNATDAATPAASSFVNASEDHHITRSSGHAVMEWSASHLGLSYKEGRDATVAVSSTNVELTIPSTTITGAGVGATGDVKSASTTTTSGLLPQNSFILSTAGGLTDSRRNTQNYVLISPIAAAATSSPNTSQLVLLNSVSSVAAVARNIMNDPSAVAKTIARGEKPKTRWIVVIGQSGLMNRTFDCPTRLFSSKISNNTMEKSLSRFSFHQLFTSKQTSLHISRLVSIRGEPNILLSQSFQTVPRVLKWLGR
nr:pre mRNA splicing factor 18 [Hymenolepis microstoma]